MCEKVYYCLYIVKIDNYTPVLLRRARLYCSGCTGWRPRSTFHLETCTLLAQKGQTTGSEWPIAAPALSLISGCAARNKILQEIFCPQNNVIVSFWLLASGCPMQFRRPDPKVTTADITSPNFLIQFAVDQNSRWPEQSVTFVLILIRTNIRIYSYQENDTNEYICIQKSIWTNIRIDICIGNIWIFKYLNIFVTLWTRTSQLAGTTESRTFVTL